MRKVAMRFIYSVLICAALLMASCSSSNNFLGPSGPDPACDDGSGDRFIDCGNGTVTDTQNNNLIWLQNANCVDIGQANWDDANAGAALLEDGMCGLTDHSSPGDWWLPTKDEWDAMIADAVTFGCVFGGAGNPPSITNAAGDQCHADGPQAFAGVQSSVYWSSTEADASRAWAVGLFDGISGIGGKDGSSFVWPVRAGP